MEYQEFIRRIQLITDLSQASRLRETEEAIYQLIMSDISDLDKADLCVKMAEVYDRLGKTEEALTWFDKGTAYEKGYARFDAARKKAEYLAQIGRRNNAIEIYEDLLKQAFVREDDKERLRKTIQNLLGMTMRGWQ